MKNLRNARRTCAIRIGIFPAPTGVYLLLIDLLLVSIPPATQWHPRAAESHHIGPARSSAESRSSVLLQGAMKWEAFTNLGTELSLASLTNHPKFPDHPDVVRVMPGYEGPENFGDCFGARMSGFITPKESGNYVFFVATDDRGELWLSTDKTPEKKRLPALEPFWASPRE